MVDFRFWSRRVSKYSSVFENVSGTCFGRFGFGANGAVFVTECIAEDTQQVKGIIIALNDDKKIKFALKVAPNIDFYRYEVKFNLIKE